jgi:O-antigen ligase
MNLQWFDKQVTHTRQHQPCDDHTLYLVPKQALLLRSDYWQNPQPTLFAAAAWLLVLSAFVIPLGSATMNIVGAATLAMVIAAGGFAQHWQRVRSHPFALASLALAFALLIGIAWTSAENGEASRILEKHLRVMYAIFALVLLVDERWRKRALYAWMAAMALTLFLSYVHSVWAFPLARATREAVSGDHYIFKHHITQNVMMSVFVVAALCEAMRAWRDRVLSAETRHRRSYVWLAIVVAGGINVYFFVAGRTAYLTLLANLVVVCIVLLHGRYRWMVGIAVGVVVALALAMSGSVRERFDAVIDEVESHQSTGAKTSAGQRLEFGRRSLELISAKPILGWGTGSYAREYCRVATSVDWCRIGAYNPHNQFLFFGVQLGALGVLVYLAWLASAAFCLRRAAAPERALGFAVLTTLLIHSLLDSPLYIVTEGAWYPLMLGILTAGYADQSLKQTIRSG